MGHVEVVVKIPKMALEYAKQYNKSCSLALDMNSVCINAIANGTQLPEGHGRLGDLDALEKRFLEMAEDPWNIGVGISSDIEDMADVINDAPAIIKADKGEE